MAPVGEPAVAGRADQPQVSLVHKCGRVERLARLLGGEAGRREPPQFVVDERHQLSGGPAGFGVRGRRGRIAHGPRILPAWLAGSCVGGRGRAALYHGRRMNNLHPDNKTAVLRYEVGPNMPPPPLELPPEIAVTDAGNESVTFALPRRPLGPIRLVGLLFLAAGGLFLYWVVRMGQANLRGNKPLGVEDYVMLGLGCLLGLGAYFPFWLGLCILAGRREISLRGGKLRATERVGPFWQTKRWPLDKLSRVEIVAFFPSAAAPQDGSLLGRLYALCGLLTDGTRFMIAPGYPRALLAPVAAEIARRCNAKFDGEQPKVTVAALVRHDPLDDWNEVTAAKPALSRAVVEEYPEGMTITLPPAGFGAGGRTMLVIGVLTGGVPMAITALARGVPWFVDGIFALMGVVGVLLAVHGVRVARRRAVIAIVGPKLLILQTGLIRSKERSWETADLETVRVGKSGIEINEQPVLELQVVPRVGLKYGLLAGRDVAEIAWIAAELRRRLGLKATK